MVSNTLRLVWFCIFSFTIYTSACISHITLVHVSGSFFVAITKISKKITKERKGSILVRGPWLPGPLALGLRQG